MNRRKLIIAVAILAGLATAFIAIKSRPSKAEREFRTVRAEAIRQGFKLDPTNYAVRLSTDEERRLGRIFASSDDLVSLSAPAADVMVATGPRTAARGWLTAPAGWEEYMRIAADRRQELDVAQPAILENRPIRFALDPKPGEMMTSSLSSPRFAQLATVFASRAFKDLDGGKTDEAFSNLLTVHLFVVNFRLGTELDIPRPDLVPIAFTTTWGAIHGHTWSDAQLAALEQVWRGVDVLRGTENLPAATCAKDLDVYELYGKRLARIPFQNIGSVDELWYWVSHPNLWLGIPDERQARKHLQSDVFATDRANLIRVCMEKERTVRRAVTNTTWRDIRLICGFTNSSDTLSQIVSMGSTNPFPSDIAVRTGSAQIEQLFQAAITVEGYRRVLLAALAVERAKLRLGRLPATLAEAGPVLPDFMDGQPLRYHPETDGTYSIHSIGLDLVDDGGHFKTDIVWPRCVPAAVPPKPNSSQQAFSLFHVFNRHSQQDIGPNMHLYWIGPDHPRWWGEGSCRAAAI